MFLQRLRFDCFTPYLQIGTKPLTCADDCDIVLALCLFSEPFTFFLARHSKNPMVITKNSVIPTDMSIAAMSKVESFRDFSGKIRKWIYSLSAFMLKVCVFGSQKLPARNWSTRAQDAFGASRLGSSRFRQFASLSVKFERKKINICCSCRNVSPTNHN